MRVVWLLCWLWLISLWSPLAVAEGERGVALVIGNSAYEHSPLPNPAHDAEDMAKKLRSLGFEVIERTNITSKSIGGVLREFRSRLSEGGVALVFYAGHGLQVDGENYFPAVDADINSEEDVPNQSLALRQIMAVLEIAKTRLNLVFLDACRNNPYANRFRSVERGLARTVAPSGTIIMYATRPGSVAIDGDGRNGLYTSKLLPQMDLHVPIEALIKNVTNEVEQSSRGKQEPWMEGNIKGTFCFGGCQSHDSASPTVVPSAATSQSRSADQIEDQFWDIANRSGSLPDFETYRRYYPQGRYIALAELRMAQIRRVTAQAEVGGEGAPATMRPPATNVAPAKPAVIPSVPVQPAEAPVPVKPTASVPPVQVTQAAPTVRRAPPVPAITPTTPAVTVVPASAVTVPIVPATSIEPSMLQIPAGQFVMGCQEGRDKNCQPSEKPARTVQVAAFEMGRTEVTVAQFAAFVAATHYVTDAERNEGMQGCMVLVDNKAWVATGATWRDSGWKQTGQFPVVCVSWNDAVAYVQWLRQKTGKFYRLPSEAEWEYVCRAGQSGEYCADNDLFWRMDPGLSKPREVSQKPVGGWGVVDLSSNVWEWLQDLYHPTYDGAPADGQAWMQSSGMLNVVLRGGSWNRDLATVRAARREQNAPFYRSSYYGFRVARSLP